MKNIFFILFLLILLFNTFIYASFPYNEKYSSEILNSTTIQLADNKDEKNGVKWGLLISILLALIFSGYFLIKSWWKAWRDEIKWVKILTYIIFGLLSLLLLLGVFINTIGLYNPGG